MAVYSLTSSPTTIEDGTHKGIDVTNTGTMNVTLSTGDVLKPGAALTICPTGAITATSTPLNWQLGGYSEATTAVDTMYDPVIIREDLHDNSTYAPLPAAAINPLTGWVHVDGFGAKGDGSTDDSAAIASAVAAIPQTGTNRGGVLRFTPGKTYAVASTLVLDNLTGITLLSESQQQAGVNAKPTILKWTGVDAGTLLSARSSRGLKVSGLQFQYGSATYSGTLVDLRGIVSGANTACATFEHCTIGSTFQLSGTQATALVAIDGSNTLVFDRVTFYQGQVGVLGKSRQGILSNQGFAIDISFRSCVFTGQTTKATKNPDAAWVFQSCVFEPLSSGAAGAMGHDAGILASGVSFIGCWPGDDTTTAGSWITFTGAGLTIIGGEWGVNTNTTVVTVDENNCAGIVLMGANFKGGGGSSKLVDFGATTGHTGFVEIGNGGLGSINTVVSGTVPAGSIYSTGGSVTLDSLGISGALTTGTLSAASETIGGTSGNILPLAVATAESASTGWGSYSNATVTRSTDWAASGTQSWKCVSQGTAEMDVGMPHPAAVVPVTVGTTYTALATVRAGATPRSCAIEIIFRDVSDVVVGSRTWSSFTYTDSTTANVQMNTSGTAPSGAVSAVILVRWQTTVVSEAHYVDQISLAAGTSTIWQSPGTNQVQIDGTSVSQVGSNTDSDLAIRSKGAGLVRVNVASGTGTGGLMVGDGAGNGVHTFQPTKIGLFGVTPASRPTLSYSRATAGETTAEAAMRTALASLGLILDSTTA